MKYYPAILLLLLAACSGAENNPPAEEIVEVAVETPEEIMLIIDRKNSELEQLYRQAKIEEAALHFSNEVIQMPPNDAIINGKEEYISRWKESAAMGTWEFDLNVQEVKASGNLAVERGAYTLGFTPNEDSPMPAFTDEGNYVVLWEKIDGDWKIVWDAPVSSVPIPMPGE